MEGKKALVQPGIVEKIFFFIISFALKMQLRRNMVKHCTKWVPFGGGGGGREKSKNYPGWKKYASFKCNDEYKGFLCVFGFELFPIANLCEAQPI